MNGRKTSTGKMPINIGSETGKTTMRTKIEAYNQLNRNMVCLPNDGDIIIGYYDRLFVYELHHTVGGMTKSYQNTGTS